MWVFADSGSTKTEWRLVNRESDFHFTIETEGLNPYFLTDFEIGDIIKRKVLPHTKNVEKVFFYGAGCGLPEKAELLRKVLTPIFSSAYHIEAAGDMLAAARSLRQEEPGISCILGTGANSCYYDGNTIEQMVPSLGYVLSDWGSGTVMSKDFISLLLQKKLPSYINEDFLSTYGLKQSQVLDKIYNKPLANRFLASFSPFILKHAEEPEVKEIIKNNFRKFFNYYVLCYPQFITNNTVSLVGSIAYHYQPYLAEVAEELEIQIDKLIQYPMDGLVKFHYRTAQVSH